jgi:hypothetical protein
MARRCPGYPKISADKVRYPERPCRLPHGPRKHLNVISINIFAVTRGAGQREARQGKGV